jgi:hypothetical protein
VTSLPLSIPVAESIVSAIWKNEENVLYVPYSGSQIMFVSRNVPRG